ncbi:hypothetical protein FSP39_002374 [Pinctada imbricata]|uniref:Leishmanolysin-like peptidase n=1 Tax=Pinctada imbricata TaxID=66713 RepID=A0AA88XQ42_PINIB|nr:hypothetical protein FSP39_002374 [Pinctada imbricata]
MSDRIVTALPKKLTDSKLRSENSENIRLNESAGHAEKFSLPHSSTSPHPFASPHSSMLSNSSIQSPGSALSPHSRPLKKVLRRTATQPLTDNIIIEEEDQHVNRQTDGQHTKLRPFSMITASTDSLSSLPEEEGEDQENGGPCPPPRDWKATPIPVNTHLSSNNQNMPPVADLKLSGSEKSKRTLALVMREMIQTERDYVLALQYIIENYTPELRREDVPQALRGKSNVIFGNLEKIYNFHRQYFLREVEMCERNPFQIAHYFLMHESQFYMYALYNKNKPKSDCLMAEYGKQFFRDKQLQLGDRMDLASYLLKPVQRMGKYALLLKQIMKECPQSEQEYQDLKAAEQMVKFQLRHGNDLLAMDSLKDCDVNLQEQGRLLRQDEFIVWQGRRKSLRHVFLFEDLILFSKTRRGRNGSPDTYIYKYSYKMADIGMTESYGDTGYKFEIWFRKLSKGDNYVLQASSSEVRHHWVREISRILWNQAIRNKETHLTEMATMGIGNKPSLDLKPSADNIQDRYINVTSGNFQARTRNSIAVSSFDHFRQNNKRPHSIISVSSNSSSSSSHSGALGAFNLGFDPRDSPRHQSCSTNVSNESGIGTDVSSGEIEVTPRADHQGIPVFTSPSSRGYKDPGKSKLLLNSSFNDTVGTNSQKKYKFRGARRIPSPTQMWQGLTYIHDLVENAAYFWQRTLSVIPSRIPIRLNRQCSGGSVVYRNRDRYCVDACASSTMCGDITIPNEHLERCYFYSSSTGLLRSVWNSGSGVNGTDFILYIAALSTSRCRDDKTIAYAAHCQQEATLDRPVAGYFSICPQVISTKFTDQTQLQSTIKHEILHALGFTAGLFAFYRDQYGRPLTARNPDTNKPPYNAQLKLYQWSSLVMRQVTRPRWKIQSGYYSKDVNVIVTPRVVREVRKHFDCDTLEGAELENQGILGTALTHWEKRIFENEAMTGTYTQNPRISRITLALLEDTGWYKADYSQADELEWGRRLGCPFVKKSCLEWMQDRKAKFGDTHPFCDTVRQGRLRTDCTRNREAMAFCNLAEFQSPLPEQYQYFTSLPGIPSYRVDRFGGTVTLADFCPYLQYSCSDDSGLVLSINGRSYQCLKKGQVIRVTYVSRHYLHRGTVICPSCFEACVGQKVICPPEREPYNIITDNQHLRVPCSANTITHHIQYLQTSHICVTLLYLVSLFNR